MLGYHRPPKRVDVLLPHGFSDKFLTELSSLVFHMTGEQSFKSMYLEKNIFSKYCDPKTTSAKLRKSRAIEKWLESERLNEKTNQRLYHLEADFGWITAPDFVCRVKSLISRILGPVRYPEVISDIVHTNGASTRVKRHENAACLKLRGEAHVSESALKHWFQAAKDTQLVNQTLVLNESSALFTVPKRSDIDRVACKEPEVNMLMQRSVGSVIRRRLKRFGIDLNDQTINQRLAADAVRSGLATIDLSSASDSISRQLVFLMLPFDWWSLLYDLRVESTLIEGQIHTLEMFSSMGNGFTFELESLLFYAITRVAADGLKVKGRISVYGDDIIAPNGIVPHLKRIFFYFGFRTNVEKTFWTGWFRESCGKHYYMGRDVSPFFVRREVSTLPDLINILNGLMEWSARTVGFIEDPKVMEFHYKWSCFVPPFLWGGFDPSDNSRLVTRHAPRYKLTPVTKHIARLEDEAYLHWMMTRENTADEMSFSVDPARGYAFKATRASRGWTSAWDPWFIRT